MLIQSMADLVKDKRIDGITDIRDESGRDGMRIVVDYRRDANGEVILNQLYKYTQLQDTCAVNMLALVNGEPKILSLPQILDYYIEFQESIIRKRTQFDLDKALREMHIFEGYMIAIGNIDEIIEIIKSSESIPDSKAKLSERFGLSDEQAQAIVDMTLGKLSGLERRKIEERLAKLEATVKELRDILADEERIKQIVKDELSDIKNKFGDDRKTELVEATDEIDIEDLIERHTCVITMSHAGYIKRQRADLYTAQHRGGKGIIGMGTKEEDYVENVIVANSHSNLMMFTNIGKVYTRKVYRIPEASRTAKGSNIANILELADGEKITAVIAVDAFKDGEYLTMVTKHGVIKRTLLSEYEYQRKGGKIALSLDEGDELLFVRHTVGDENLIIATHDGYAVRFSETNVRSMGRLARGVRGITLGDGDYVVGVALVSEGNKLLTITENGYGKRSEFDDFREMKNRGGRGVTCHNINEKTGKLAAIASVGENDDIMIITNDGTIIRTPVSGINVYSRSAGGVIVMRLSEGATIVNFAKIQSEEDIEKSAEEAEEELRKESPAESVSDTDGNDENDMPDKDSDDSEEQGDGEV